MKITKRAQDIICVIVGVMGIAFIAYALLFPNESDAAASAPVPRLARSLPARAVAAHDLRARHNAALKTLFENTGIPLGNTASNIAVRAEAIELINYAITNGVALSDADGITADAVADAAGDFIGRYVLGVTNSARRIPRSERWRVVRDRFLREHPFCAACYEPAYTPHHIVMFAADSALELDTDNLIGLCYLDHFELGHFRDWRRSNPDVRWDCAARKAGHTPQPLLIVGDSHAACRLPHSSVDSEIVANLLGVPPSRRLAVSGATAAQWSSDYLGWLADATNCFAPVVWISIGGNDAGEAASDGRIDVSERISIAARIYDTVFAIAQHRMLVIGTLYADPFQGSRSDYAEGVGQLDMGISNIVSLACGSAGVPWALLDEREVLGRADYDGSGDLHPDANGYTNMALRIRAIIKGTQK
jgi:lysophospholipase L1-like esterase